jgi:hypothetical protein
MRVTTHPDEAGEVPGQLDVAWSGPAFLLVSAHEPDLARRTLSLPDQVDISYVGFGWTRHERSELAVGAMSNRLLLWDLPSLLEDSGLAVASHREGDVDNTTASGHLVRDGVGLDVQFWVRSRAGVPLDGWLASPQGRESPYRFDAIAFTPFPIAPSPRKEVDEVNRNDGEAQVGHSTLIQLVRDYAGKRSGALPDSIDPDTLRLELLASRKAWPTNPYDGQPFHASRSSGQFGWVKCNPNDGVYVGYGWDTLLVLQSFGAGCKDLPTAQGRIGASP